MWPEFTGNDNSWNVIPDDSRREPFSWQRERPRRDRNEKKTSERYPSDKTVLQVARRKGGVSFGCRCTLRPTFLNNFRYLVDPSRKICMRRSRSCARAAYTRCPILSFPLTLIKRGANRATFIFGTFGGGLTEIYSTKFHILKRSFTPRASPVMYFT